MAARTADVAQIGGGDPRVVAHPSFRDIPKCQFDLASKKAQQEYDTLARLLFDAGRMTLDSHRTLSSYAMQFDVIQRATTDGRPTRAAAFIQMDKAREKLRLDDIDKPIAAAQGAPTNKFARSGFSARRR